MGTAGFSKAVLPEVIICGPWGGGGERLGGDDPEGQDAGEADQEGAQDGPHPLDHLHLVPRLQGRLWGREGHCRLTRQYFNSVAKASWREGA